MTYAHGMLRTPASRLTHRVCRLDDQECVRWRLLLLLLLLLLPSLDLGRPDLVSHEQQVILPTRHAHVSSRYLT